MPSYSSITIIYNPNSTGSSKQIAENVAHSLRKQVPKPPITVLPTQHTGYAETKTYQLATSSERPLIISASGDGGYHEVINGAMRAVQAGYRPLTGLLPAGNANDHWHSLHQQDVVKAIVTGTHRSVDILKLTVTTKGASKTSYAHSYIGLGLTPQVGKKLAEAQLNRFNEAWLTLSAFFKAHYCLLAVDGVVRKYDNFVISNVPQMAKFMTLAKNAAVDDGLFEVTQHIHRGRLRMFLHVLQASSTGLKAPLVLPEITFQTINQTRLQADGEIMTIDKGATITITSLRQAIDCFI